MGAASFAGAPDLVAGLGHAAAIYSPVKPRRLPALLAAIGLLTGRDQASRLKKVNLTFSICSPIWVCCAGSRGDTHRARLRSEVARPGCRFGEPDIQSEDIAEALRSAHLRCPVYRAIAALRHQALAPAVGVAVHGLELRILARLSNLEQHWLRPELSRKDCRRCLQLSPSGRRRIPWGIRRWMCTGHRERACKSCRCRWRRRWWWLVEIAVGRLKQRYVAAGIEEAISGKS
jgi:hypothetical protein